MKYIVFDNEINSATISELINEIVEKDDDCIVYFQSNGGEVHMSQYFIDFTFRHEKTITLISSWQIQSSAFDLFMFSKTKKIIMSGCYGMTHCASRDINTSNIKKPSKEDTILSNDLNSFNDKMVSQYKKIGLSKKHMADYCLGEDVFLDNDEMIDIASKAEKLVWS